MEVQSQVQTFTLLLQYTVVIVAVEKKQIKMTFLCMYHRI